MVALGIWFSLKSTLLFTGAVLVALGGISWLVSFFELQYLLLLILSVLLPFSVETQITDGLNINFPSEPILAIAIFTMGWDVLRKRGLLNKLFDYETLWVLPFLLCFIGTSFFSTIPWVSLKFSIVNITYVMVFFVWLKHLLRSRPDIFPKLIMLYSISLFVVLLFSVIQFRHLGWIPSTIRGIFQPFYKDHTIFGATSAMLTSFWVASAFRVKTLTIKLFFLFLGLVFVGGTVLSTSRAAALSLVFFVFVFILLQIRFRISHLVIGFACISLFLFVFRSPVYNFLKEDKYISHKGQFGYVEQLESSANISTDISNRERLNRWTAGLAMFIQRPLTGFGPGTYQFEYIPFQKKEFMSQLTVKDPWHIPENSGGTAHSEYLLAISEMGIIGIVALLVLISRWFWIAFVKARSHPQRTTIIIGFAVIATYLFHAFFNNFLSTDKFAFLFWGTAAWMVSQSEMKAHESLDV